ncbi:DASH family cryptochrome [Microbulbifer yueqingensis]|uniref:Cryptochrome DASH n=1 Tax=Microbulbifer yueqingensis TaxID=658219 RepID=A0A1G8YIL5_9GAMM|nr:DASH family cryptochrome [Microbulbifer yueqingensis]SDK01940.1 deoxyribodipyrimidine photo-lyase (single-stranded DNA-specific) [Microbulbifer yueqingensis]
MNLIWFRNDLRTDDNHMLAEACRSARRNDRRLLAVYCLDPRQFERDEYGFRRTEKFRARFLLQTLADLREQLAELNIPLLVARDHPGAAIPALVREHGITDLYLQREWTRDERQDLERITRAEGMQGVKLHQYYDQFLLPPDDIPFAVENLPRVFTAFRKACEADWSVRPETPRPQPLPAKSLVGDEQPLPGLAQLGLQEFDPDPRSAFPFAGGERAAQRRIQEYFWETENLARYKHTRNGLIGTEYSSKLSPWLANGSLSARQVYWQVKDFERKVIANEDTYWLVFELLWRDFFQYVSLKHGDRIFHLGGIMETNYEWHRNPEEIRRWIDGESEYDFVNANMCEIAATGWMSNRGRQNVASYFARERQQDWRIGAAYFESLLLDYDVHSNYGNWMYNSGVGNDPRDRRFNIGSQAERYDPDHAFRRLWLDGASRSS